MPTYFQLSLTASTHTTYTTGVKPFLHSCRKYHPQPLPASKDTLVYFATDLCRSPAPGSIKVYTAAVGSFHRQHRLPDPTRRNNRLKLVLRGATRAHCLNKAAVRHKQRSTPPPLILAGPRVPSTTGSRCQELGC